MGIRYSSRTGRHNAFKAYRAMSLNCAIKQLYAEMASRHATQAETIALIKTAQLSRSDCVHTKKSNYQGPLIQLPKIRNIITKTNTKYRKLFSANRPSCFA